MDKKLTLSGIIIFTLKINAQVDAQVAASRNAQASRRGSAQTSAADHASSNASSAPTSDTPAITAPPEVAVTQGNPVPAVNSSEVAVPPTLRGREADAGPLTPARTVDAGAAGEGEDEGTGSGHDDI